jgi:hypothetical protein
LRRIVEPDNAGGERWAQNIPAANEIQTWFISTAEVRGSWSALRKLARFLRMMVA